MYATVQILREEHAALAAMLRSLVLMIERGPGDEPERFFDVLRAMLFYIDEFPEQRHHPNETNLLFPKLAKIPGLEAVIARLEKDHARGESRVRELQHMLLGWELLGESRSKVFARAAKEYVTFYLEHMKLEETEVLPAAEKALSAQDWRELDAVFERERDPLAGGKLDAAYNRLFTKIVMRTPAPIGVGPE